MVFSGISLWPAIYRAENPHIFKSKICSIFLSVSIRVCRNCSFSILSGSCWISRTTKGSSSAFCVYSSSLFEKCSQNLLSALKSCQSNPRILWIAFSLTPDSRNIRSFCSFHCFHLWSSFALWNVTFLFLRSEFFEIKSEWRSPCLFTVPWTSCTNFYNFEKRIISQFQILPRTYVMHKIKYFSYLFLLWCFHIFFFLPDRQFFLSGILKNLFYI